MSTYKMKREQPRGRTCPDVPGSFFPPPGGATLCPLSRHLWTTLGHLLLSNSSLELARHSDLNLLQPFSVRADFCSVHLNAATRGRQNSTRRLEPCRDEAPLWSHDLSSHTHTHSNVCDVRKHFCSGGSPGGVDLNGIQTASQQSSTSIPPAGSIPPGCFYWALPVGGAVELR